MSCCYQREYAKSKSSGIRFSRKTDTYCRESSGLLGGSLSVVIGVTASHHVITINEFGLIACTTNLDQPAWTSLIFSQSNSTMTGARIEPATFYDAMTNVLMFHYKYRNTRQKHIDTSKGNHDLMVLSTVKTPKENSQQKDLEITHLKEWHTKKDGTLQDMKQDLESLRYKLVCPQTFSHTVMCKVCLTASNTLFYADAFVRLNH